MSDGNPLNPLPGHVTPVLELKPNSPSGNYDFVLSSPKAKVIRKVLIIRTSKLREVLDLTGQVRDFVAASGIKDGLLSCFNKHTTSGLVLANRREGVGDLIPELLHDVLEAAAGRRGAKASRDPETVVAYISSAMLGASVSLPIESGKCKIGDWQGLYFVEMAGPRDREVVLTAVGV